MRCHRERRESGSPMRTIIAAVFGLMLVAEPSQACQMPRAMTPAEVSQADTIFVGRVVELALPNPAQRFRPQAIAVTIDVERVVRGREVSGRLTVYGYDSIDTRFRRSIDEFQNGPAPLVEVAIVFPDTIKAKTGCRYRNGTTGAGEAVTSVSCGIDLPVMIPFKDNATIPLDHPTIIGIPCGGAYIRPVRE